MIAKFTDIVRVQKLYKLTNTGKSSNRPGGKARKGRGEEQEGVNLVNGGGGKVETGRGELEMMVLGSMALRGAT